MKRLKKSMMMVIVVVIVVITSFSGKVSRAAVVDAFVLQLNGEWSSNYYLTETNREQYYQITIPYDGKLDLRAMSYFGSNSINNLRWELYNSDLSKRLAGDGVYGSETSPQTQETDNVLAKGTYYMKIYSDYGTGKYLFQLFKLTQNTCSHDYEKTWHDATYFARGYRLYYCPKCGHTYMADYEEVKKLGQPYVSLYGSSVGKGKIKVSWGTVSDASGYQIRYAKKRNMKSGKTITVKGAVKNHKTIRKLSRRKKYYVQVRAYKKSDGKEVYGKWSQKKYFKTK